MTAWFVVPAAGLGRRMGTGTRKQFLSVAGRPILVHTLTAIAEWPGCRGMVVVAPADEVERTAGLVEGAGVPHVVAVAAGGARRQDSVRAGLEALGAVPEDDLVLVHDGVRPFPPVERFAELCAAARPDGALLAVPCRDTLKREREGAAVETLPRHGVWQAQTPQAFPAGLLRRALERAEREGVEGTDEASLVEALGCRPRLVAGDAANLKITHPEDLPLAEALAAARGAAGRFGRGLTVGHGYDVHRLAAHRKLVLGGVEIAHDRGLLGHSDADVLAHAVADACLGAAGLGDLGRHFPDSDDRWRGASSLGLLRRVAELLRGAGVELLRVDATLVAQRPKVAPQVPAMEANLARALGLAPGAVTVKATTTEGLGFEGRMEGISAHAVALADRVG
ncbi:MAG: bifunctional 2-C-methyl-D-erythritol 4-phosphate cytidylyltransferase/2-C-methyl-D-erythritol 2,4-cyclodiphosphate synthase [Deferrisomatales bacterium]